MATRSAIGVMHGNNYKMVYCHWDGYLEYNGEMLLKHYDSAKANHLVALGNISSLKPEIGEKHPFSQFETNMSDTEYEEKYGNMTTFYGRDRDETDQEFKTFDNFVDAVKYYRGSGAEFIYIMRDGEWFVTSGNMTGLIELRTAMKQLETV